MRKQIIVILFCLWLLLVQAQRGPKQRQEHRPQGGHTQDQRPRPLTTANTKLSSDNQEDISNRDSEGKPSDEQEKEEKLPSEADSGQQDEKQKELNKEKKKAQKEAQKRAREEERQREKEERDKKKIQEEKLREESKQKTKQLREKAKEQIDLIKRGQPGKESAHNRQNEKPKSNEKNEANEINEKNEKNEEDKPMFKLVFFLVVALVIIIFILLAKFLRNNNIKSLDESQISNRVRDEVLSFQNAQQVQEQIQRLQMKVKELKNIKAKMIFSAYSNATNSNVELQSSEQLTNKKDDHPKTPTFGGVELYSFR